SVSEEPLRHAAPALNHGTPAEKSCPRWHSQRTDATFPELMTAEKTRTTKTETSPPASSRLTRTGRAKKIVAITGAASFLGKNLVGLLEEDERIGRIVAIDLTTPSTAGQRTRAYEVDLT